ncbi:DUF5094 domain-containing protein [Hamiltosporidium tvaerminnensis]|uniref:DUF5094 domain-containing protein n=1 Tax=Hamiltosporidium tvaerminnensis TaxID=1176355 RepID=A0A4V2JXM7_9MICR|nr:DUF5094 domain-containing protein [Hamiltosporidium tvaerminnensis]TBU12835.1 DUF5094 domain-containing protein [Hamiltosporidium tvaerminnensis]
MKTPRSRITFKTPKKRNIKTPLSLKQSRESRESKESRESREMTERRDNRDTSLSLKHKDNHTIPTENKKLDSSIISTENTLSSLLESYREENKFLRNLKNDSLIFQRLVGLSIKEVEGKYECTHTVTVKGVTRYIVFLLIPDTSSYVYKPVSSCNVSLPEYLSDSICFTEEHIQMGVRDVLEDMLEKGVSYKESNGIIVKGVLLIKSNIEGVIKGVLLIKSNIEGVAYKEGVTYKESNSLVVKGLYYKGCIEGVIYSSDTYAVSNTEGVNKGLYYKGYIEGVIL